MNYGLEGWYMFVTLGLCEKLAPRDRFLHCFLISLKSIWTTFFGHSPSIWFTHKISQLSYSWHNFGLLLRTICFRWQHRDWHKPLAFCQIMSPVKGILSHPWKLFFRAVYIQMSTVPCSFTVSYSWTYNVQISRQIWILWPKKNSAKLILD